MNRDFALTKDLREGFGPQYIFSLLFHELVFLLTTLPTVRSISYAKALGYDVSKSDFRVIQVGLVGQQS
jgi:hypothetical protein